MTPANDTSKMWKCMAPEGEMLSLRQCAAQRLRRRARNHFAEVGSKPWQLEDPHGVYTAPDPNNFEQHGRFIRHFEGDLLKQGHVRKNWKGRFFQLDADFLKYYEIQSEGGGGGGSQHPRRGLARSQQFTKSGDFQSFTVPVTRSMRLASGSISGVSALLKHGLGHECDEGAMGGGTFTAPPS